jgi:hypothetical protein
MSSIVENTGSTARDFCMLERNILSHFKLGLLLSLLSSSILLHARLPGPSPDPSDPNDGDSSKSSKAGIPMATIQFVAALVAIAAGAWEYWSKEKDLRSMRAFLMASK